MAPLPEDNTKRYWLAYHCKGETHHAQMRTVDDYADSDAISTLTALAVALQPMWANDCGADGVLVAEAGSNVRNPVAGFTPVVGTHGGTTADINLPFETTWTGRARSGRRWEMGIFCLQYTLTSTWPVTSLTGTGLDTVRALFVAAADHYLAIDHAKPVFNNWVNFSYNDHWIKAARV